MSNNTLQAEMRNDLKVSMLALAGACSALIFIILLFIAHRVSTTISEVSSQLQTAGLNISEATEQLSGAGQSLSQASTSAAASLEETVASLDQIGNHIQQNSNHATEAAQVSSASKTAAEQGEREIKNLVSSMHEISLSSKKIEEITSVIDDIAFQTNLLALNAAVEAARAGEQGKGFAVVADAVRTLAQRSSVAAKDISQLIRESVTTIEKGSHLADHSGEALVHILRSISRVAVLNSEIAEASQEQKSEILEINKTMTQLDQGVQSNASASEEIAATTIEISVQAQQMKLLVSRLNQVVIGTDNIIKKAS